MAMAGKRRLFYWGSGIILCGIIVFSLSMLHLLPLNILSVQQKPEQPPQKVYDYYLIIDEDDGHTIMYVPLVVNLGDEVLSEDNRYYQIVKIEENRAYARFIKTLDLEKYKQKLPPQENPAKTSEP
ncbi:MAG: hypothetical protein ABFC57_17865 [Veillonellales bacterium]